MDCVLCEASTPAIAVAVAMCGHEHKLTAAACAVHLRALCDRERPMACSVCDLQYDVEGVPVRVVEIRELVA